MSNTYTIRYCSLWFRNAVLDLYPALKRNPTFWDFLQYIIYANHLDEESGNIVMSHAAIAECMRINPKKFSVTKFAREFSKHIFPVILSQDYSQFEGKARTMINTLPTELQLLMKEEKKSRLTPRVRFSTGMKAMSLIIPQEFKNVNTVADAIIRYHDELPKNRFTKSMSKNMIPAQYVALDETICKTMNDSNILEFYEVYPKPTYKTVANTVRVFSVMDNNHIGGISFLKREVRETFCKGWWSADLKAAQYAIIYKLWNMDSTFETDLWGTICSHMNLDLSHKPQIKDLFYSVIFGMGRNKLIKQCNQLDPKFWKKFKSVPVVRDLLLARRKACQQLLAQGYGVDAYGTKLPIKKEGGRFNCPSVLAQIAQSYEQQLIFTIYELASVSRSLNHGFTITVNIHDGVYVDFHDQSRAKQQQLNISDAVLKQAKELGINTELEWKLL